MAIVARRRGLRPDGPAAPCRPAVPRHSRFSALRITICLVSRLSIAQLLVHFHVADCFALLLNLLSRPFLLLSTLFVDLLFIVIGKIGDRMAGWETIDDDMDDVLLCAVKAKRAKRRRKLEANKKPKTRPRRLLLLSSNILLLLLSITEAVLLLIFFSAAASNRHARTAAAEQILPFIGAALAYAWVSIRVHQSSPDAVATSILFRLVSAVSLVLSILILVSALIGAYTGKLRTRSAPRLSLACVSCGNGIQRFDH